MFFGDIQITNDLSAAAIGFHRYRSIPPPSNYRRRLADAAGPHARQFELLDQLLTQVRPTEPHYHLAVLAVLPAAQRRGIGAAMLTHHESRLDRIHMPSWTETTPYSQDLYRRHGYLARPRLTLPDGPVIAPLRRNPHPARGAWPVNTAKPATVTAPTRAQPNAQR
ncbi:GNAT family N-acetyltransferase [Micromonospora noduli]|uniref:GNAT family N-acetyltransferase n=1 Tax=Micromonospora noduli TaxID=709876 RepID=UPI000DBFD13A|nr:GNAT family N-acetyltransferase [Micromonospora noduli]RAO15005.1 hypothetical protein GUI43_01985 [Micromonospora noduli]